jgi:hypothetical protein
MASYYMPIFLCVHPNNFPVQLSSEEVSTGIVETTCNSVCNEKLIVIRFVDMIPALPGKGAALRIWKTPTTGYNPEPIESS